MIPTTPPAKRKTAVNSKKGVETMVEQTEPTAVKMTPKPSDRVVRKAAIQTPPISCEKASGQ